VADVSSTCYLAEWGCSVACKIFWFVNLWVLTLWTPQE
jgi:hypothetical protein